MNKQTIAYLARLSYNLEMGRPNMAKREATMTIRVTNKTLAAIDMIVGELRAKTGEKITQDRAIWEAIKDSRPEIATRVERFSAEVPMMPNTPDDEK